METNFDGNVHQYIQDVKALQTTTNQLNRSTNESLEAVNRNINQFLENVRQRVKLYNSNVISLEKRSVN